MAEIKKYPNNSLHLTRKYILGYFSPDRLFVPKGEKLTSRNRYVQRKIPEHIFKILEYHSDIPHFFLPGATAGAYFSRLTHVTSRVRAKPFDC